MTKLSRKKLHKSKTALLIDQLWRAITLLEDKNEVHEFLHDILTRTELLMIAKRLEIVKMLEEGYSYTEIKKELKVTDSTIAKMHEWKEAFGAGYGKVIYRLHEIERKARKRHKTKWRQVPIGEVVLRIVAHETVKKYRKYRKRKSTSK